MPPRRKSQTVPTVAVIGYGSQGRAIALNLRDSGYPVIVGLRSRSKSRPLAGKDGIEDIRSVKDAVREADVVAMAFPDHLHGRVYTKDILPNLKPTVTLLFLHGLSVHFGMVTPPDGADVIMIAPHAPGAAVREKFLGDRSVSGFYAIGQDRSRRARSKCFALAAGIGIARGRLIPTTFADEAIGDLFGEQAVLCGGLAMLIKSGFEVLVENGHKPEHAWLEVAYQLDLIIDLIKRYGIEGMFARISVAARVGSAETGPKLIDQSVKKRMQAVYKRVRSGAFVKSLAELDDTALASLKEQLSQLSTPELERAARRLRAK
ncbi:ketol-acid reductoisomerase [bacterium]|nr:ketol-acid reductoisomerase [bacterium]